MSPASGPEPFTHCSVGNRFPARSALSRSAQALANCRADVSGIGGPAMLSLLPTESIGTKEKIPFRPVSGYHCGMAAATFDEILARARTGDEDALTELARQYEPEVRAVARVRLGPALRPYLDTMDLVQSVHRSLMVGLRAN